MTLITANQKKYEIRQCRVYFPSTNLMAKDLNKHCTIEFESNVTDIDDVLAEVHADGFKKFTIQYGTTNKEYGIFEHIAQIDESLYNDIDTLRLTMAQKSVNLEKNLEVIT